MDQRVKKNDFGFFEIADKPTSEELKSYYAEKYYQQARGSYEHEYSADELEWFRYKLEQRWAIAKALSIPANGTMLDIGCGEGYGLAFFRTQGLAVKGLDFSDAGVKSKNPDVIDALVTGDLFQLIDSEIAEGRKYDLCWLQNVLEHVIEPVDLLVSIRNLVKTDGLCVVTVPNDYSPLQDAAKNAEHIENDYWVGPPDHLSYFNYSGLQKIAAATKWECLKVTADFPIEWYLFDPHSNYIRDKSVGKGAHRARVQLENLINSSAPEKATKFWEALADIGMGRNLTCYLRPVAD